MSVQPDSRHIAILDGRRKSKTQFGDRQIAWFVAACNGFLQNELKRLYPEDPVWTVDYYTDISSISLADVWPMHLLDDDGYETALGHHYSRWGIIGAAVDCLQRSVDEILRTILHELEMCFNPYIIEWAKLPDGRETPREAGDPVQWDRYYLDVSMSFGGVAQHQQFAVQNMVGARYWGELPDETSVPFDLKGNVTAAHQWPLRGYRVIRDKGKRYNEFGAVTGAVMGARTMGPGSRTWALIKEQAPQLEQRGARFRAFDSDHECWGNTPQEALGAFRAAILRT